MGSGQELLVCLVWRKGGWRHLLALCSFLRKGNAQRGAELFSQASKDRTQGNVFKLCRGGLDWTLGSISVPTKWGNTATGFLERGGLCLGRLFSLGRPRPVRVSEAFGQCPLQCALTFGQPWSAQAAGLDDHCRFLPSETVYSIKTLHGHLQTNITQVRYPHTEKENATK